MNPFPPEWKRRLVGLIIFIFAIWALNRPVFFVGSSCRYNSTENTAYMDSYGYFGLARPIFFFLAENISGTLAVFLFWPSVKTIHFNSTSMKFSGFIASVGNYNDLDRIQFTSHPSLKRGIMTFEFPNGVKHSMGWTEEACWHELQKMAYALDPYKKITSLPDNAKLYKKVEVDSVWDLIFYPWRDL